MNDLFQDKAAEWDTRPLPTQISAGVFAAIDDAIEFSPDQSVLDFGAGTGLISAKLAPHVGRVLAVDISPAMLDKLMEKPELEGKVQTVCQDILKNPLERQVDIIVSAMAMHHVEDTDGLFASFRRHLRRGGKIAVADLDAEDGSFHPPGTEGVFHAGFARESLRQLAEDAGFVDVGFVTACTIDKDERRYSIFLLTATSP